ncbi:MAG: pyrrolysine--tRNA(Pyl) ligase large subunit [Candidatus Methanosuratincola petrocarbonis]
MTEFFFTPAQKQRLVELGAEPSDLEKSFKSEVEREDGFNETANVLTKKNVNNIKDFLCWKKRPFIRELEDKLRNAAIKLDFSEVITPTIIPKSFIEKMSISEKDPLWNQIIWVGKNRALRPMLAPSLYVIMTRLRGLVRPVRIFEIGQCFRLDTKGPKHLEEFTMLNMVELAPEEDGLKDRLLGYIDAMMGSIDLDYTTSVESSEVYGETIDVMVKGIEVASAAIGPKPIDVNWGVCEPWIGVGFGLERLAMLAGGYSSVARVSRSLSYLDGSRLDVIKLITE